MSRRVVLPILILLAGSMWGRQNTSTAPQTAASDTQNVAHGVIPVLLSTSIDSKKAKEGTEIMSKTAALIRVSDGTVIPSGTKIIGHLTEATALSKGDPQSSLGMVFDKIEMTGGKELKIKGALQAIAPALEVQTGAAGPGTMPQNGLDAGSTMPPPSVNAADSSAAKNSTPILNAQSRGVLGFRDLNMGLDSLLTSNAKQIRLNSGTQLMLSVQFE